MTVTSIASDDCGDVREAYAAGAWFARVSTVSFVVVAVAVILMVRKRAVRGIVIACVTAIVCALVAVYATYANMRNTIENCHDGSAAAGSPHPSTSLPEQTPSRDTQSDEQELQRMAAPAVAVDSSGIYLNGQLVVAAAALPQTDLLPIEPLAAVLHDLSTRLASLPVHGPIARHATVTIDAETRALAAGCVLLTIARAPYRDMTVRVGAGGFNATYLATSPALPTESYLYLAPHAPSGFSMRRDRITRNLQSTDPPCRDRTASRVLASEREIDGAATKLCDGSVVDCADHIVLVLPTNRTFGEVEPWVAAALRTPALSARQLAFVAEGTEPFPDATDCTK